MVVTRSKTGALPAQPAPATAPKPATTKRKSASSKEAANKVPKTEDKPELAEAKKAAVAASDATDKDEGKNKNGTDASALVIPTTSTTSTVVTAPSAIPAPVAEEPATAAALEAVKEPVEAAPLPDMTSVLENPTTAQATEPVSTPPAPTAPSTATIPAPVEQDSTTAAPARQEPVVVPTEEPLAHSASADAPAPTAPAAIQPFDVVVSDIEGTTTPISFVKDNLFPYVTAGLAQFLNKNWGAEEMQKAVEGLREQAVKDLADGVAEAVAINVESAEYPAEKVQQDVIACIGWQMKADRKIGALKDFQGYMWREGYASGDLKGEVYDDVIKAFDQWKDQGKKLYIYSSGSVPAQKLLFGHSEKGDLLHYFSGHYDTKIGLKVEADSYTKIAQDIGVEPSKILFLSDNIHEIKAAKQAGMQAIVLDRPGNAELSPEDRANHLVVTSFMDIPQA